MILKKTMETVKGKLSRPINGGWAFVSRVVIVLIVPAIIYASWLGFAIKEMQTKVNSSSQAIIDTNMRMTAAENSLRSIEMRLQVMDGRLEIINLRLNALEKKQNP